MITEKEYFDIKDHCRKGLLKYLEKAISAIPVIENPQILDAGCGSGVPALLLAEKFNGTITAVDPDTKSMAMLEEKVQELNLAHQVNLYYSSIFDLDTDHHRFDLIIAEGLLNVTGFQKGFLGILRLLKKNGFIIIHDELRNRNAKTDFIEKNDCRIIDSFVLDEIIWWDDYYQCLESAIFSSSDKRSVRFFKSDLEEIESFRKDSSQFQSIYFVIERN